MRKAELLVVNKFKALTDDRPASVLITMYWQWAGPWSSDLRSWKCLPGYLKTTTGHWEDRYLGGGLIDFFDEDGDRVGTAYDVDVDLVGYPLDGLAESRQTGLFTAALGGLITNATWRFISD